MTEPQILQWLTEEKAARGVQAGIYHRVGPDIVAFANGSGGVILIGVDDDASLVGLNEVPVRTEERSWALYSRDPSYPHARGSFRVGPKPSVMVVTVAHGSQKPYTAQDVCYVRAGSTSRRAHPEELRRLALNGTYIEYEKTAVAGLPRRTLTW